MIELYLRICTTSAGLPDSPPWMDHDAYRLWAAWAKTQGVRLSSMTDTDAWEFDPQLRWRLKPNVDIVARNFFLDRKLGPDAYWHITTNRSGFRSPLFDWKKEQGGKRIVLLGDSNTMGWLLDDKDTYPARLQNALNRKSGRHYEVINLGVGGYTSYSTRVLLDQWMDRLEPDLVIVSCGANDPQEMACTDAEFADREKGLLARLRFFTGRLELVSLLRKFFPVHVHLTRRVTPGSYERNLFYMFRKIRRAGADALFLKICCCLGDYDQALAKVAGSGGIRIIDARKLLEAAKSDSRFEPILQQAKGKVLGWYKNMTIEKKSGLLFFFPDRCHLNRFGALIIGEKLADIVSNRLDHGAKSP